MIHNHEVGSSILPLATKMKVYQTYIIHRDPPSNLELLVQLISVCNHRVLNPNVPIVFVTDRKSYGFFESWGFLHLYDEVITHLYDDYPYDRINEIFWSTPKLWLMSKISAPFVIMDIDLMFNKPVSIFHGDGLIYLHRELSTGYLRPYEVSVPMGWDWDGLDQYFRQTLPINVSVIYFGDENFKKYYLDHYFRFVLDNPADIEYLNPEYIDTSSLQTFAEQYMLSALLLKYSLEVNIDFKSKSLSNSIHGFGRFYEKGNFDSYSHESLNPYVFHLWGGKENVNIPDDPFYSQSYYTVVRSGEDYLKTIGYWDLVKDIFQNLKKGLVEPK
jgi:hypothetical protein